MSEEDKSELINEVQNFLENFSIPEKSEDTELSSNILEFVSETDLQVTDAVSYVESYFWKMSELPPHTVLNLTEDIIKDKINPRLKGRGIPEYVFHKIAPNVPDNGFDPRFVLACNQLCTVSGKSKGARFKDLKSIGVTESTWNAWMNIPSYFKYAKELMETQFESVTDVDAKMALARNVANGDLQSIKYYHEFTGRYRPQDANAMNMMVIIGALLEVLVKNVSAEVFEKIASELESTPVGELMRGQVA